MSGNRGGLGAGRGRGGSFVGGGGGSGRGGAGGGQSNAPLRGQHSRNFGAGNKDFNNRRSGGTSGSFNAGGSGGYPHQGPGSFRGRNQGQSGPTRGGRSDNTNGSFVSREATQASSFGGKKDENRRTLTDFKIVGLAISDLEWTWGTIPSSTPVKAEDQTSNMDVVGVSNPLVKEEGVEDGVPMDSSSSLVVEKAAEIKSEKAHPSDVDMAETARASETAAATHVSSDSSGSQPPPSRIRIYFHTPVTADDSRPIPHNSSYGDVPTDTRKGKRKKLEDDEGDMEERRVPPPPQMGSVVNDDRLSVTASAAPSVAETTSEADWLMAAIVEGEEEAEAAGALHALEDEEEDQSHISSVAKEHHDDVALDGEEGVGHAQIDVETVYGGKQNHAVRDVAFGVKASPRLPGRGGISPRARITDFFPLSQGTSHHGDELNIPEHGEHITVDSSGVARSDIKAHAEAVGAAAESSAIVSSTENFPGDADDIPTFSPNAAMGGSAQHWGDVGADQATLPAAHDPAVSILAPSSQNYACTSESASVFVIAFYVFIPHTDIFHTVLILLLTTFNPLKFRFIQNPTPNLARGH